MRDIEFRDFKKCLLRGGVAPKHVARITRELSDHHADLEQEAKITGISERKATDYAWNHLGDERTLIINTLAQKTLRSWAFRWPWAIYTITPLLILISITAAFLLAIAGFGTLMNFCQSTALIPEWIKVLGDGICLFISFLITPLIAISLILVAQRRESTMLWPIIGGLILISIGCAMTVGLIYPSAQSSDGAIYLSVSYDTAINLIKLGGSLSLLAVSIFSGYAKCLRQRLPA